MKLEKLRELCKCKYCNETLSHPLILPCGENICKRDLKLINSCLKCPYCLGTHHKPDAGFQVNNVVQELIGLDLNKLNFGQVFDQAKQSLNEFGGMLKEFELMAKSPAIFVDKYFDDLANEVHTRREEIMLKVNQHFSKILQSLIVSRVECKHAKTAAEPACLPSLNHLENALNKSLSELDTLVVNESKWLELSTRAVNLKETLNTEMITWKKNVLQNKSFKIVCSNFNDQILCDLAELSIEVDKVNYLCLIKYLNMFKTFS